MRPGNTQDGALDVPRLREFCKRELSGCLLTCEQAAVVIVQLSALATLKVGGEDMAMSLARKPGYRLKRNPKIVQYNPIPPPSTPPFLVICIYLGIPLHSSAIITSWNYQKRKMHGW